LQAMLILKKRKNLKIDLDQITGFILAFFTGFTLAFFTGNTSSLTDSGQEYNWCPAGNTMGSNWCRMTCITKSVSSWQASRTSVQLGEPSHGVNYGTWTMTNTICATIKRLMFIMRSSDQTEFIYRRKTSNLTNRNVHIFTRWDQIRMPVERVLTEKTVTLSQEHRLAMA